MSNNLTQSIETLPVEILHCILDNLDAETILYSIRPLSRLFQSVVNIYNRYILNFTLISKANFYLFCRLIHPENIISLTLSNDGLTSDQIDLFISLVHLRQMTRLRSLILLQINEDQLNFMLQRINLKTLTSLLVNIRKYNDELIKPSPALLSLTTTQTNLRKLEFDTYDRITKISWEVTGITEYLTTNNRINIDDLRKILQCSPYLHILILNEIPTGTINNLAAICFRQLTSLTINDLRVTIDELEVFLSLTSSLAYLKLIGGKGMLNGKRWEQFIQINLPQLDKFEFYFNEWRRTMQTLTDLKLTINSFNTPFWIEHKKWFVDCEYECTGLRLNIISLYSIPICTSYMYYKSKSEKKSLSTYPMMKNNDLLIMDNIKSLCLTLNKSLANDIQEKVCYQKKKFYI
jgi:hypothetical protein